MRQSAQEEGLPSRVRLTALRASSMSYRLFGGRGEASSTGLTRTRPKRSTKERQGGGLVDSVATDITRPQPQRAGGWGRRYWRFGGPFRASDWQKKKGCPPNSLTAALINGIIYALLLGDRASSTHLTLRGRRAFPTILRPKFGPKHFYSVRFVREP